MPGLWHRDSTPRLVRAERAKHFGEWYPHYLRGRTGRMAITKKVRQGFSERIRHLEDLVFRPGKLLDLGCGDGVFLALMAELGWKVRGIELDADMVASARDDLKLEVRQEDLESFQPDGDLADVVTMWGVLQLLEQPQRLVQALREQVRPGGLLAIGVSNLRSFGRYRAGSKWAGWGLPRHLIHYDYGLLRRLLESSGWRVVRMRGVQPEFLINTTLRAMLRAWPLLPEKVVRNALRLFWQWFRPRGRIAEGLEVFARRK